ncbi:uncharacterized protein N7477_004469 [Penicillium maclennaniae]|uniref:uncharacterized protein n=1 Tax=Penicillium maclennaniae TaxID=1343394 RepID=UPI00253F8C3D|nr:uncharacterized protein N7477_004469 [Penicillium maclennaniae]KAJ5674535.1 hypothetical protein N7477_004469 [Penicillium maclennaniae]
MVCAKCQKKLKSTELATPGVKRKNDMYYGSPSTTLGGSSAAGAAKGKSTLGNTGIGKNKLLSAKAKNPYAAYASSCETCKTKTEAGKKYCQRCAYQKNACPMCGKSMSGKSAKDQPVVQGQKFNLK